MARANLFEKNNDGVALMLVLVFVLLLGVVVVDYCYETQVEASQVANMNADFEAYMAAKSAVATAMAVLQADWQPVQNQPVTGSGGTTPPPTPMYDARVEQWAQLPSFQEMNNAKSRYIIEDESGKLNLNALVKRPGNEVNEVMVAALRNLFAQMDLEEDPTDAILDWLDDDDDVRDLGAESDDYEGSEIPYSAKNGPMNSIEELLLIRGITPEVFFDLNRDPKEEEEKDNKTKQQYDEAKTRSLADLLTVYGNPEGKINVNTARRELLEAVYQAQGGDPVAMAEAVMQRQLSQPMEAGEIQDPFVVESDFFRIQGDGRSGDTLVRVEAYVQRMKRGSNLPQTTGGVLTNNGMNNSNSDEPLAPSFRILDWRVYR